MDPRCVGTKIPALFTLFCKKWFKLIDVDRRQSDLRQMSLGSSGDRHFLVFNLFARRKVACGGAKRICRDLITYAGGASAQEQSLNETRVSKAQERQRKLLMSRLIELPKGRVGIFCGFMNAFYVIINCTAAAFGSRKKSRIWSGNFFK